MTIVFEEFIPDPLVIYLDDGCLKGAREADHTQIHGVRAFVARHLEDLSQVLNRAVQIGMTFGLEKCAFCFPTITTVGMVCGPQGKTPTQDKIATDARLACTDQQFRGQQLFGFCKVSSAVYQRLRRD